MKEDLANKGIIKTLSHPPSSILHTLSAEDTVTLHILIRTLHTLIRTLHILIRTLSWSQSQWILVFPSDTIKALSGHELQVHKSCLPSGNLLTCDQ